MEQKVGRELSGGHWSQHPMDKTKKKAHERSYFKIGSYDFFDKILDLNVGNAFLVKPS